MDRFVRILESDDWIIDYDKEKRKYRVSYFEDFHFVDEIWFDAYEDKEVYDEKIEKFIKDLEAAKNKVTEVEHHEGYFLMYGDKMKHILNLLINRIKKLK